MKKNLLKIVVFCGFFSIGLAGIALANKAVEGDPPAIMVSPSVIVLEKVSTITIHSNIPASDVESGSIDLNGTAPTSVGVDSCGHLVAKFEVADLGLEPGETTLTLCGVFEYSGAFCASDMVTVK